MCRLFFRREEAKWSIGPGGGKGNESRGNKQKLWQVLFCDAQATVHHGPDEGDGARAATSQLVPYSLVVAGTYTYTILVLLFYLCWVAKMCYGMPTSQLLLQGAIPLEARLVCTVRTTVSNSTRGSAETDLLKLISRTRSAGGPWSLTQIGCYII